MKAEFDYEAWEDDEDYDELMNDLDVGQTVISYIVCRRETTGEMVTYFFQGEQNFN